MKKILQGTMLVVLVVFIAYGGASAVETRGFSGKLYADTFGDVYVEGSAFSIGRVDSSGASGPLHADVFGDVFVGNWAFSVGKVNSRGSSGRLWADEFGRVYVGDSPFPVDTDELFQ